MYLFETCPYKVTSKTGELTCFDTVLVECFKRHRDIIRDFCREDFRECPYYRIHGARARFGGERRYPRSGAKRLMV